MIDINQKRGAINTLFLTIFTSGCGLSGIDVNHPTGKDSRKASPEDTYAATYSALKAGVDWIILSRKYSEM